MRACPKAQEGMAIDVVGEKEGVEWVDGKKEVVMTTMGRGEVR